MLQDDESRQAVVATRIAYRHPVPPLALHSLNTFGKRRLRADLQTEIDGVPVEKLVERCGSPLYVTSEQRLRANIRRIRQAFAARYQKVIHGWSYKTNYNGAVCSIFHQEGSWAEVVSLSLIHI